MIKKDTKEKQKFVSARVNPYNLTLFAQTSISDGDDIIESIEKVKRNFIEIHGANYKGMENTADITFSKEYEYDNCDTYIRMSIVEPDYLRKERVAVQTKEAKELWEKVKKEKMINRKANQDAERQLFLKLKKKYEAK